MRNLKTTIMVTLSVDGIHRWERAKDLFPEVAFLSDYHRHTFKFKAAKAVYHDDRDVEFILFKRNILEYLHDKYYNLSSRTHFFDFRSCEMLAKEILDEFDCEWVEVWEDDECGARQEVI
jgi:hypothetical protein